MKTNVLRYFAGLFAAVTMQAGFESVAVEVTVEPQLPAALRMAGLREGRVVVALDISADGRITDCLVTAASHTDLIRPCVESLRQWRYTPARYDGAPVPARLELSLNISPVGAVVSRTVVDTMTDLIERIAGRPFDYRLCPAAEVDRPLVARNRVSPEYARDAQQQGVGGRVRVHFFVDERGDVRLPAVPAETHPYLSAVAVEAMRGWKFEPPTRHGRPVLVAAVQEFDFGAAP